MYALRLHVVFVTKYRRKCITPSMLEDLRHIFSDILTGWRCRLIEFGGEADHVHLLIEIHPALQISTLINNLKSASSRRIRAKYAEHL
ncbi:MAG: IS200/IS605 family transposase, partial [Alicyclobacillus macrosporangiidus]|nr:IS200/IS605 family transposase [Alicyclobacillus macrosporangiidus]